MSTHIQQLLPEHAEIYRQLRLEALAHFPGHFANSYAVEAFESISFFKNVLQNSYVAGLWQGESLVGCAVYFQMWPRHLTELHKGMVAGVYIKPEAQGQGLAKKLMLHMLEVAKQHCKQVHIALYSSNTKARKMYDELGFVEYGREPDGLCVEGTYYDKVWMFKKL